ncbi:hypothetical protein GBAR_LOCUS11699 [Geodia barretti]|uniref:Uncharacterized protein n=1 Tax=Geodia barretti TaxID=519541 RepID=A0AA35WFE4_GEOBA|nr:hypothetical protein GBAR_LOCUS11699 [Geodia barretti]
MINSLSPCCMEIIPVALLAKTEKSVSVCWKRTISLALWKELQCSSSLSQSSTSPHNLSTAKNITSPLSRLSLQYRYTGSPLEAPYYCIYSLTIYVAKNTHFLHLFQCLHFTSFEIRKKKQWVQGKAQKISINTISL